MTVRLRGVTLLESGSELIRHARRRGLRRAATKILRALVLGRRRIYLTRTPLLEAAARPLETNGLEVRLARPDDPLIGAFPHLTPPKVESWLGRDYLWYVILLDGRLVSYRCVSTTVDRSLRGFLRLLPYQIYTVFIYTGPQHRHHGLTRISHIAVARELVQRGFREAWSAESPTNHSTVIATERKGVIRVGTLTRTCLLGCVRFSVTPVTTLSPEFVRRHLTPLKQVAPNVSHVGLLFNPSVTTVDSEEALKHSAAELETELTFLPVRETVDQTTAFDTALATARAAGIGGLIVLSDPMMKDHRRTLAALANRHRLPAIFDAREFVAAGGLMACGSPVPCLRDFESLVAYLDVRDPAGHPSSSGDLDLIVNRKTAAALGLVVQPALWPKTVNQARQA